VCKLEFERDVLTHPGPCSSFFFSAWWIRRGRVDGNSSPRVRKFPFSVPFIPHSFYLLLSFYLPQKRGDLRIRRTINFCGEAKALILKNWVNWEFAIVNSHLCVVRNFQNSKNRGPKLNVCADKNANGQIFEG